MGTKTPGSFGSGYLPWTLFEGKGPLACHVLVLAGAPQWATRHWNMRGCTPEWVVRRCAGINCSCYLQHGGGLYNRTMDTSAECQLKVQPVKICLMYTPGTNKEANCLIVANSVCHAGHDVRHFRMTRYSREYVNMQSPTQNRHRILNPDNKIPMSNIVCTPTTHSERGPRPDQPTKIQTPSSQDPLG